MKHLKISLEDEKLDGKAATETEFVIYARLLNPEVLSNASEVLKQFQASRKGVVAGSQIRVRREQALNVRTMKPTEEARYILTGKAPKKGSDGLDEVNAAASPDLLEVFKQVAGEYMQKTRYVFPTNAIPSATKWEVDVFHDDDGINHEYIKIDLEIKDESIKVLPSMPPYLELTDVIIARAGKYASEEQQIKVQELYKKYFITKVTH